MIADIVLRLTEGERVCDCEACLAANDTHRRSLDLVRKLTLEWHHLLDVHLAERPLKYQSARKLLLRFGLVEKAGPAARCLWRLTPLGLRVQAALREMQGETK